MRWQLEVVLWCLLCVSSWKQCCRGWRLLLSECIGGWRSCCRVVCAVDYESAVGGGVVGLAFSARCLYYTLAVGGGGVCRG